MSVKEPWSESWQTRCRIKIKGCSGVIALLSKNTINAKGARWEMKCSIEEGVPIIGLHISRDNKGSVPPELTGKRIITWSWDAITNFINSL
ncbi:MAG: hypothetical protein IIA49_07465 [Bacteroidetes bacterium]|nr:hypothetical protein [Bacteroidota bacterium]